MKAQSRDPADRTSPAPHLSRESLCTRAAAALVGAALASSVLVTADAASVYAGASLPQVLLILVAGLVASFGKKPLLSQGRAARLPLVLLAALFGWLVLSSTSATWLADGRAAWNGFWHVVALIVLGLLFRQFCQQSQVARATAQLLVMGAIFLSVHAVHQYAISLPEARARYAQNPDRALAELGLDAPPGSATRMQFENRLRSTEPLATFALTNSLAVVLSAMLVFQGILLVDRLRRRPFERVAFTASALAWLLVGAACLLTKSRTAVLAVVVIAGLTAAVFWRLRSLSRREPSTSPARRWQIAGVAALGITLFAGLVAWLSRDALILSEAPRSLAFRLEYWQATSKMILDYPLTGVGLGNFQSYYPRYKLETASETVADPHNWLFDIAACCSLPVLAMVLTSLVTVLALHFSRLRQHLRATGLDAHRHALDSHIPSGREGDPEQPSLARALWIGAGVGWVLTAALQWILQESIDLEAAGLGLVVSLVALALIRRGAEPAESIVRGAALAATITMLVCLLASGSWQASGIALPLIAWLAVSSFGSGSHDARAVSSHSAQSRVDWRSAWQPAVMAVLLAAFILQTWQPVNSSWTHQQQALAALQRGDIVTARQSAEESRAADPINPAAYRLVTQTLVYQAGTEPPERLITMFQQVETSIADLLECDPASNLHWEFAAESQMTLAAVAQSRHATSISGSNADSGSDAEQPNEPPTVLAPLARLMLERAATFQRGAVERYPSSVALHAQLGVILSLLDRSADADAAIERAFALSEATPHADRKLDKQQIWLPASLAAFPAASIRRPAPGSDWVAAEPLCRFLRNKQ